MKLILSVVSIGLFLYALAICLLYVFQRNVLYYPTPKYEHPFKEFSLTNDGESISVIALNEGNDHALLYFGGNGEAVVANAEKFTAEFPDVTIYLFNYRGYGGSSGSPTEIGIYADALALYDTVNLDHSQISVAGRSLGSGVATYLAANRPTHKVVLVTPYDSILNVAKSNYGFFPVGLLLQDTYDSASRAKNIRSDVLVIVAEYDEIIPMSHTQALIDEFENLQVKVLVIKNTGHNSLSERSEYYEAIKRFL